MKKKFVIQFFLFVLVSIGIIYIYMFSGETKFIETKKNVEQEIVKIYLSFDEVSKSKNLNLKEMDKAEFNKFNNGLLSICIFMKTIN